MHMLKLAETAYDDNAMYTRRHHRSYHERSPSSCRCFYYHNSTTPKQLKYTSSCPRYASNVSLAQAHGQV